MSRARSQMLLALGSPDEPEAQPAIEIVLESLHAEAVALSDEDTSSPTATHRLALACRLEALKGFVADHVRVTWREEAAK